MRYRELTPEGDYQFGRPGVFLINSPEAVVQAIRTRLALQTGEWFLDLAEGTPYRELVLGYGTQGTRDQAMQARIVDTPGVRSILTYNSSTVDRVFTVTCTVETDYGTASFTLTR